MRLKKIKLSGFKSFCDVATVPVDKNLVGIVGPNGCGKSNVIDAVRWVMGESSAKQLRGDSMTDVIFNGTASRKPVSQASIELVFDNTVSPLLGQYAKYSEIAIKRVINREAQSSYYMNNTKCRRKDLSDLFLGTGLGPRSYSIIEQGMISRVIEAKPEDLRVYFEEAAGISKYKERRRETENRIKHTRENLDRVNDIREELGNQLEKLARQAEVAEQYKVFKQDLNNQEQYHLGLQYKEIDTECSEITKTVQQKLIELEQYNSQIETSNTLQEEKKIAVSKLQHEYQEEQAKFYKLEQKISTIEQEIKHQESQLANTRANIQNIENQTQTCTQNLEEKTIEFEQVSHELLEHEPEHQEIIASIDSRKELLTDVEQQLADWETKWHEQQELIGDNGRVINQSQALIEKHDTLIVRSQRRIDTLRQEQLSLKAESKQHNIAGLREKQIALMQIEEEKLAQLDNVLENFNSIEEDIAYFQEELNSQNDSLQSAKGRLTSLTTLQENALGKDQKALNNWLAENNLSDSSRLGEIISIESGWERALETILRDYIKAIVLPDNIDALFNQDIESLAKLDTAFISRFNNPNHSNSDNSSESRLAILEQKLGIKLELLTNKINTPKEISHLLNNIYCIDIDIDNNVDTIKNILSELATNESIITKDGRWLNNNWFTVNSSAKSDVQDSILAREQEIKSLEQSVEELQDLIETTRENLTNKKSNLEELKSERDNLQAEIKEVTKNLSDLKSEISRVESKIEQQSNRLFQVEQDISEAIKHVEVDSAAVKTHRAKLEKAMGAMEDLSSTKSNLQSRGDELKDRAKEARFEYDEIKDQVHKSELKLQKLKQQKEHLTNEVARLEEQKHDLIEQYEELKAKVDTFDEPINEYKLELEGLLDNKSIHAQQLSIKNQAQEAANQELNTIDKTLSELRKQHEKLRDSIQEAKIKQHELSAKLSTVVERIAEQNLEIDAILNILPSNITINEVRAKLRQLRQKIEELGPVNLTAIDEYNTESERKIYLDAQEADLQKALTALEDAIEQIDIETKSRFKETYDFVNEQFKYLFPKVFGGGRASLSLSGEDLLDTGITVMAQPPGKRNASIHLLSGGEKALTAIALVFAIFRLNPAPFCMLDEVDAPLDDANVARYCNLVKEMSRDVQFIFITHNKVAMTMAQHLIGVTMNEPGASRLVAVDVEQAAELAEM